MKTANYVLFFTFTNTIMCMADANLDEQLTMEDFNGFRKNNKNGFRSKIIVNQNNDQKLMDKEVNGDDPISEKGEDIRNTGGAIALCQDNNDWIDNGGDDCAAYGDNQWCEDCDYGTGWDYDNWGDFADYGDVLANCKTSCGCKNDNSLDDRCVGQKTCGDFDNQSECHGNSLCIWHSNQCVENCVCVKVDPDDDSNELNSCNYYTENDEKEFCYVDKSACAMFNPNLVVHDTGNEQYAAAGLGWSEDICNCQCLKVTNDGGNGAACGTWCYMYKGLASCSVTTIVQTSTNTRLNAQNIGWSRSICA